jgi:CheY-like chemotaxis protein
VDRPDADTRELLSEALGSGAHTADSAGRALEELIQNPADVLISDIGMPAEDALSHIRHVRAVRACTVGFPRLLHRIVHDADAHELRKPAFRCPAKPVDLATLESELLKLAAGILVGMIGPIRPELCLFSLVSAFVHLLRSSINIASVPNAGPARAAVVQSSWIMKVTRQISSVQLRSGTPHYRFIPAKCCPREGGTLSHSQARISQCAPSGISAQTWTIGRHGVNWHRGVF